MKKLFLLFFLLAFTGINYSQGVIQILKYNSGKYESYTASDTTVTSGSVRLSPVYVSIKPSRFSVKDSISGTTFSKEYDFKYGYTFTKLRLYNKGADADTVSVQNYSILGMKYLNSVGFTDELTSYPVSDLTSIIINPGEEKLLRSITPCLGKVKVSAKVNTGQAPDKVLIEFEGIN